MKHSNITTDNTEFVLASFEGPDCYSMAGGLGVRMQNLSHTLAQIGFPTHLFFIGDPTLPAEETQENGKLTLHRWSQWISQYHPGGVYDGEEGKLADFTTSIPGYLMENIVQPAVARDKLVMVLGEEWQTAETMCRVSDTLYEAGLRNKAILFWNANNTFSFHRINWARLNYATTITTISRYMKHIMERMGLNPLVIPNGIPKSLVHNLDEKAANDLKLALGADVLLCKIARWDPDKRWMEAIEATARLKGLGLHTTLLARGGKEPYGQEIIDRARSLGLVIKEARSDSENFEGYLTALKAAVPADIIDIRFQIPLDFLSIIYRAADAVLANSGHEPFGIVGLEAMAAGGIVFTGSTGEDYAIPFVNSLMIETADPMEIVSYIMYLKSYPQQKERMRRAARITARLFTWEASAQNLIGKLENQARIQGTLNNVFTSQVTGQTPAEMVAADLAQKSADEAQSWQELQNSRCLQLNTGEEESLMPKTTRTKTATKTTKADKTQIEKLLAKVPEAYVFWVNDGRVLRDINDLKDALATMPDQTFTYHANESKNDFSNWVRNIIGDERLAKDLEMVSTREQAARLVDERYTYLRSQIE